MSDFKKAERLIKSRIINEKYAQSAGHTPNQTQQSFAKRTEREFPIKHEQYKYPEHGLNVGPIIYRTNNMNYGNSQLIQDRNFPLKWRFPINIFLAIVHSRRASPAAISNSTDSIQPKHCRLYTTTSMRCDRLDYYQYIILPMKRVCLSLKY